MADARDVGAQFFDAFNAHDEERMRELTAEGAVLEGPGEVRLEGRDAVTEYGMNWLNAFPDARLEVTNELVAGEWVVQEFTFNGTHQGTLRSPAGEIPPTNRDVHGRAVQILRIEGDAVADTHLYFDQVELMTQLGLMPEPATA
jgi:predicted ester cyclase